MRLCRRRDVSDYGGGAFPEFRTLAAAAASPAPKLVYFDETEARPLSPGRGTGRGHTEGGAGLLKLLECSDAVCSTFSTSV